MGKTVPEITVPPSKSLTHRALICAALAGKGSQIENPLACEDTLATDRILSRMWAEPGKRQLFNCIESGTTWRFMTAILYALGLPHRLTGNPSLLERPIEPLVKALKHLGEDCRIEGKTSSQFLSALLLAAPLMPTQTTLTLTTPLVSKAYVAMTLAVQQIFGITITANESFTRFEVAPQPYRPARYAVEGDWSSAAFWIAAGLVTKGCRLRGLTKNSLQPDREIVSLVREMGGKITWEEEVLVVSPSPLKPVSWDLAASPDLFPVAALLRHLAGGKSDETFRGIERLRHKESDRPAMMRQLLENPTAPVTSTDHRIVMAAAILNLTSQCRGEIRYPERVGKSYPTFWEDYEQFSR